MIRNFNFGKTGRMQHRINEQIRAETVRVIDAEGKQVGVLDKDKALTLAREREVDLVEVAENARPPVVKLIDYSKFLYQLKKKKQEEKRKTSVSVTKQIRMGPFIGEHDLDIKLNRAKEFFQDGDKVKFTVRFQGRQMAKIDMGRSLLQKIIDKLNSIAKVDREIHMEGRQMTMNMSRIK